LIDVQLNNSDTALLGPLLFSWTKNPVSSSLLPWLECFFTCDQKFLFVVTSYFYHNIETNRISQQPFSRIFYYSDIEKQIFMPKKFISEE